MNSTKINARMAALKERLRNNYWLMPGAMLIASIALALASLQIDRELNAIHWKSGWLYMGGADGARALLSTLAGATLTLAGVVFSMNLVALTMASAQFGPRLLYNFVRDPGSQFTLGAFTAIFAFCIVTLREVNAGGGLAEPFIPHVSDTIAGVMSVGGIAVLIYFMHHVATHIQAPVVVANVGRELERSIRQEFQHKLEPEQERTDYQALLAEISQPDFQRDGSAIASPGSGYIQGVDFNRLVVLATRYDMVLKLLHRPGDFAIEGSPLLLACPADKITKKLANEISNCIVLGRRRTSAQDIEFVVNELCEVGVRCMSPAINDPFTCISCIDWLAAGMEELFQRDCPHGFLCDDEDNLRLVWNPVTHAGVMDAGFNQIRQFGYAAPAVMIRLLDAYARIAVCARSESERGIIRKHAEMAIRSCRDNFKEPNDLEEAESRYKLAVAHLAVGGEI